MKLYRPKPWGAAIFGLLLAACLAPSTLSAPPSRTSRLWVQYRPGEKASTRQLLQQLGAVFHYDFGDLESFVVSLPQPNVSALSGSALIADYWYASMMSASEPTHLL